MARRRGRPRQLWVSTDPLNDVAAFWRFKKIGLNSFRSMRAVAFCFVWQREGGSAAAVVASGHCGRRTAFNRLRECHLAGLEPELVEFQVNTGDHWLAMERHAVSELEEDYRNKVIGRPVQTFLRRLVGDVEPWERDIAEDTTR